MAKKEEVDKGKAGTSAAGGEKSEKPAEDDAQGPATLAGPTVLTIETVDDLEACYPRLVSEIRDEVVKSIEICPVKELKTNLPMLYQRIAVDVQIKSVPALNVPGFLLEVDDPFAKSTLRTFQNLKRVDGLRLPYVLSFKDKATRATLENYALRAAGGGDEKRANAAIKAMEKIK